MDRHTTHQRYREHEADLLGLVGDIYQAGLEPERWPEVLGRISRAFDADLACIYTPRVPRPDQFIYLTHNLSESTQDVYSAYYNQLDAWTLSALTQDIYHEGLLTFGEQLVPQRELRRTEFYNDFLKPNGMEWMITTALLDGQTVPHMPSAHMTFMRHSDHASFELDKIHLIELLTPHVRRALLTQWQLAEARLLQCLHESALDNLGYGLILLDQDGKVMHTNGVAEKILQAAKGLAIRLGRLTATNPAGNVALAKLVHEAILGIGGDLCLERPNEQGNHNVAGSGQPYCLSATPLREGYALAGFGLHAATRVGAMLMIRDPERGQRKDPLQHFAVHHHLTPAETRVLMLLLDDLVPKQIAAHLDVAIRTVRTQLSSLYTKTGTRNQRELVKAVMGYDGHVAVEPHESS